MIMPREVFGALLFVGALCGFFFWPRIVQFYHWLKGSRKLYTIRHDSLYECMWGDLPWAGNIIEFISHPFFPKAILHGKASKDWRVGKVSLGLDAPYLRFGAGRINLVDRNNLSIEQALRIANNYSSLQAMLDRIAELERQLKESERQRKKRWAGIRAILELINLDRSKYRSQSSERIRRWLEIVNRKEEFSNESEPGSEMPVLDWLSKLAKEVPAEKV